MRTGPTSRGFTMAAALGLLLWATAAAGQQGETELHGSARVWAGSGLDTNPRRDFTSKGVRPPTDVFGSLVGQLAGSLDTERLHLSGNWEGGGRKFLLYPSEDTEVQTAWASLAYDLTPYLGVGVEGTGRDRRGAERDYSDLTGSALIDFFPDRHLDFRVHAGAHRFLFWDRFDYSFATASFGGDARYRFDKRHSLTVFGAYEPRKFNAQAAVDPNQPDPVYPGVRKDSYFSVGAGYQYRGPWQLAADYAFTDSTSNSFGQSFRTHRLSLRGGVHLPFGFLALAQGVLQLVQYPDGVYLSPDLIVLEDDENSSSVSLKLLHPLGRHFEVDARYGFYFARLPNNGLNYLRHVVTVGLAFHY